ncbi:Calycin-like protein [Microdochium bolleyi]|uniref:Calycin-like protein n=1 Tax=Microdochium bolleyi TaxID=196109 RepID=A0A136IL31_9PEZI|nr:Calycin-like protein [Microdochium bolleyi]
MHFPLLVAGIVASASAACASNVVPSLWDGECYYPTADIGFDLDSYLGGRWFQVAGTIAPFTANCKCIFAQYSLDNDGNVAVNNTCEAAGRAVNILGTAKPANSTYGASGVLRVQFPGSPPPECPGPNYIVQDYTGEIAIVQASNFSTLFVLSRKQHLEEAVLDAWIERAGRLGSNLDKVVKTDQSDCAFV